MSNEIGAENSTKKSDSDDDCTEYERFRSVIITNDNRNVYPNTPQNGSKNPSWTEKGTLVVLFFTFLAALFAGYEAMQLANLTNTAVADAETAAAKQSNDTAKSLEFARQAADAANRSAGAAQKSADAAAKNIDVFINAQRAKLAMSSVALNKTSDSDAHPTVGYALTNIGRTPATATETLTNCEITKANQIPTNPVDPPEKIKRGEMTFQTGGSLGSMMGPNALPACSFDQAISPADWADINLSHRFIVFDGFVRYEDAFHKYRWHFGAIYNPEGKYFTTAPMPQSYNQETIEDQAQH